LEVVFDVLAQIFLFGLAEFVDLPVWQRASLLFKVDGAIICAMWGQLVGVFLLEHVLEFAILVGE
ncbi:hypothetical protein, partial [Bacillus sp. SRB_8]|uniref:hypothetical protein n=1 Tax=Bacillus sp. SRB_8 TaxID=1969377 RepID=UPI000DC5E13A